MKSLLRRWWGDTRPHFVSPLSGLRLLAVSLEPVFRSTRTLRCIGADDFGATRSPGDAAPPGVLVGTRSDLLECAATRPGNQPTHALVVLTLEGKPCLSDAQRDELWNAYQVPLFEQVITADGHLVAWECEAHDGLHLAGSAQAPARSRLESHCECGSTAPRIVDFTSAPWIAATGGHRALPPERMGSSPRPIPT